MQRQAALTLADLVLPRRGLLARGAAVLTGTLLIALSAQITIPFAPVPLTGQTFAVLLVAAAGVLVGGKIVSELLRLWADVGDRTRQMVMILEERAARPEAGAGDPPGAHGELGLGHLALDRHSLPHLVRADIGD